MRGVGGEACSVRAHWFGFFYSRFAPGFAPDPGSNAISLHRTRVGGTPHDLNENVALHRTPSHSIASDRYRGCSPFEGEGTGIVRS